MHGVLNFGILFLDKSLGMKNEIVIVKILDFT